MSTSRQSLMEEIQFDASRLDQVTRDAIDWMVLLTSGRATDADQQAFNNWLHQNPAHMSSWQNIEGMLQEPIARLHAVEQQSPGQHAAARHAITDNSISIRRRKLLGGGMALLVLSVGSGAMVNRAVPLGGLLADASTVTGQRRELSLDDGSTLILNARSAINIEFSATQRLVRLNMGELVVKVVPDSQRPFIVETDQGSVRALGTRYLVRQEAERSLAVVLEHSVEVMNRQGQMATLEEGEGVWFDKQSIYQPQDNLRAQSAWLDGILDVRDESLGEVIERLRPYRKGLIRVSPEAAKLRVFGVFRLDDIDRVFQSLAETLPVTVESYSPWLTVIDSKTTNS